MKAKQQVTANKIVKRTALNKDTHSYSNSDSSRTERPQRTLGNSHSQGHSWSHEPCWLRDKTPLGLVQWTRDFFSLSFFNSPSASLLMSASLCQAHRWDSNGMKGWFSAAVQKEEIKYVIGISNKRLELKSSWLNMGTNIIESGNFKIRKLL